MYYAKQRFGSGIVVLRSRSYERLLRSIEKYFDCGEETKTAKSQKELGIKHGEILWRGNFGDNMKRGTL